MKKIYILLLFVLLLSGAVFAAENSIVPTNSDIITLSSSSGSTPLIVDFEPSQSNQDTKYKWEFSNGETIYSNSTTQIFSLPGEYSATLTQTRENGESSS